MAKANVRLSTMTVAGIYLFLFILFLWPLVDLGATVWPFAPRNLQWRYGFLGLLTAYWHTPILAMVLAMLFTFFLGHRKAFFGLSYFSLFWALGLFGILILFPLDVIQARALTPEENRGVMMVGGVITIAKHITAFGVVLLLGWGGLKTGKTMAGGARTGSTSQQTAEILKAQQVD